MHLEGRHISPAYEHHVQRKGLFLFGLAAACALMVVFSISRGAVSIPPLDVVRTLLGGGEAKWRIIVLNIRLPQTLAALIAGGGLSWQGR